MIAGQLGWEIHFENIPLIELAHSQHSQAKKNFRTAVQLQLWKNLDLSILRIKASALKEILFCVQEYIKSRGQSSFFQGANRIAVVWEWDRATQMTTRVMADFSSRQTDH